MRRFWVLVLFLNFTLLISAQGRQDTALGFQIIVNAQNRVSSIDREFLADVFLKKITRWPDDTPIQPVDLKPDSQTRTKFSKDVFNNRTTTAIKNYWQQLIFSGQNIPPPELLNDEEVIRYVLKYSGSIGYISNASLSEDPDLKGIKPIMIK